MFNLLNIFHHEPHLNVDLRLTSNNSILAATRKVQSNYVIRIFYANTIFILQMNIIISHFIISIKNNTTKIKFNQKYISVLHIRKAIYVLYRLRKRQFFWLLFDSVYDSFTKNIVCNCLVIR